MIEYRDYQRSAISALMEYIYKTPAGFHPLIAMPTGTGKSIVLNGFVFEFLKMYPQLRFVCVTHVKELVVQNAKTMVKLWPSAPVGIFSAGLKSKQANNAIIFGSIQSMIKKVDSFGWRDFIIVDEAHLVSEKEGSQYQEFISKVLKINPNCRVIGLTATAWRTKSGELAGNGGIFTDTCVDVTDVASFNRLIAQGYLSPLIARPTKTEFDMSKVKIIGDDYAKGDAEKAVDKDEITRACLTELCQWGENRRSWLIFSQGKNHAEHISDMLNEFGIPSTFVHSGIKAKERDVRIADFKQAKYRAIVNYGILTTGFDDPKIDLIGMLRATRSPGLWVQMLGRGTRPSTLTGKINCLCLDFGGNAKRLGPINDPVLPKTKKGNSNGGGEAPIKICPACGNWCHSSVRFCEWCNTEFVQSVKLTKEAGTEELIRTEKGQAPITEWYDVERVWFTKQSTYGQIPYLKCIYYVKGSLVPFTDRVYLEHPGMAKHYAHEWWRARHAMEPPETVDAALLYIASLRNPRRIKVWVNKIYNGKVSPEVVSHEF